MITLKVVLENWETSLGVCFILMAGLLSLLLGEVPQPEHWRGLVVGAGVIAAFYASFPVWKWACR